jgi:hypothetical protein
MTVVRIRANLCRNAQSSMPRTRDVTWTGIVALLTRRFTAHTLVCGMCTCGLQQVLTSFVADANTRRLQQLTFPALHPTRCQLSEPIPRVSIG